MILPSENHTKGRARGRLLGVFLRLPRMIPGKVLVKLAVIPGLRRIYYRLLSYMPHEMLIEVRGNKMYLTPGASGVELSLFLYGDNERIKTRVFCESIKKGMTVLDLGAHIGYYTLIAAKLVGPEGKVFAFEPDPKNFPLLERNVALNGYKNVTLVQKAVSDKTGIAKFYLDTESWGHSLSPIDRSKESISVSMICLDGFIPEDAVVDVIKMNIEGAEGRAIRGMERLLSKGDTKAIVIDLHLEEIVSQNSSPKEIWDKLTDFGFEMYDIQDDETGKIEFTQALHMANKRNGGIQLLCLRRK